MFNSITPIHRNRRKGSQKLKLLQLSLHYVLPKLRSTETVENKHEDLPLFIEVLERKEGEQEEENWDDNFEVTQTHEIVPNNA